MFSFGRAAPFAAAACFLPVSMTYLLSSWTENYGDPSESKDLLTQSKGELLWPLLLGSSRLLETKCASGAIKVRPGASSTDQMPLGCILHRSNAPQAHSKCAAGACPTDQVCLRRTPSALWAQSPHI
ncbi:hypothetical protein RHMOL_Rhmol02G0311500 [Rhododendron molle]|uniref:Uncharacterized protein n=1 Tax=Rhododendron molle TaxID=49168 RepID=A0ACC0PXK5_RHOML|nr:hypothetical protein RHMOL_Rhmol02G0311500 [Rhododendron molle]